jgi:hypothetical protein
VVVEDDSPKELVQAITSEDFKYIEKHFLMGKLG